MTALPTLFALALLPAAGNLLGGLLAEWYRPSGRLLSRALHGATGVILAIVALELVPRALQVNPIWAVGLSLGLGGAAYVGVRSAVSHLQGHAHRGDARTRMWMIYIAVVADLFSDGLMLGVGAAVETRLALTLAIGQVLADVPEGFATIANLRAKRVSRADRLLLSLGFVLPVLLAAALGHFLLRDTGRPIQTAVLVFTGGLLLVTAIEDMLKEAHQSVEDIPASTLSVLAGFVAFSLVSAMVGAR